MTMLPPQDDDRARAWIRLPSRRRMDLMNPDPQDWTDLDLARKLARTPRWAGESCWPVPLSVAQHSLTVLALVRGMSTAPLTAVEQLRELLHDGEEALLGFDPVSPFKRALGEPFRVVADRLLQCVFERYGVPQWDAASYVIHKRGDTTAAAGEAVHVVGWSPEEVVTVLGITAPIPALDPLVPIYRGMEWEPWPAELAEARFLEELVRLQAEASR